MKLFSIALVVFTAVLLAVGAPVQAQTDNTFDGSEDDDWNTLLNWSLERPPTNTENAIIPANQTPFIGRNDTGVCQIITLAGTLRLKKNAVLTLGSADNDNSAISGTMTIGTDSDAATLKISKDHTITGDGGTITLKTNSLIDDNGVAGDELTIDGSCAGPAPDRSCSLVINGRGSIAVELTNQAYVVGNDDLKLTEHTKTSNSYGFWYAEGGGSLTVLCDVAGPGSWLSVDSDDDGFFVIGSDGGADGCVSVSGNVLLKAHGTLLWVYTDSSFCTSGNLELRSLDVEGFITEPAIYAGTNATAAFGGTCPACQ